MSGVPLTGKIVPQNNGAFPVTEDIYALGGLRAVADVAERNLIPVLDRKIGMVAVCQDTLDAWQLDGGITNADWAPFAPGGGDRVFGSTLYVDNTFTGTSTGSQNTPFATIQTAVDAVVPGTPTAILLAPRTYTESVTVPSGLLLAIQLIEYSGSTMVAFLTGSLTWNVVEDDELHISGVNINGSIIVTDADANPGNVSLRFQNGRVSGNVVAAITHTVNIVTAGQYASRSSTRVDTLFLGTLATIGAIFSQNTTFVDNITCNNFFLSKGCLAGGTITAPNAGLMQVDFASGVSFDVAFAGALTLDEYSAFSGRNYITLTNGVIVILASALSLREYGAGLSGAAITLNFRLSAALQVDLNADCVFTFTDPLYSQFVNVRIVQDATGSRSIDWPASVLNPPIVDPAANSSSELLFFFNFATGTYYCFFSTVQPSQIIVADIPALKAYDATFLPNGATVQVKDFDSFNFNRTPITAGTSDNVNLVLPTGGPAGSIYERLYHTPATQQLYTEMYVNELTGDDTYPVATLSTPLKTLQEAFNRLRRLYIGQQTITINYEGTAGKSFYADLTGFASTTQSLDIIIRGPVTTVQALTVATSVVPVPSTNTRGQVTFTTVPSPAFALGDLVVGSTGNYAYVTGINAGVYSTTNFFQLDGTVAQPGAGNPIDHAAFTNIIGNVNAKLPSGVRLVIRNCTIAGTVSAVGDSENPYGASSGVTLLGGGLLVIQCKMTKIQNGTGPVVFSNCHLVGVGTNDRQTNNYVFDSCTFNARVKAFNARLIFSGSTTFYSNTSSPLALNNSTVLCETRSGLCDMAFWMGSSIANVISLSNSSLFQEFCTVFGNVISGNAFYAPGANSWVIYSSDALPVATFGSGAAWGVSGRTGSFADWPVANANVPFGFVRSDYSSGTAGFSRYLAAQSANTGVQTPFTSVPRKGSYRISMYIAVKTAGTAGTLEGHAVFTDDSGVSRDIVVCTMGASVATLGGIGGQAIIETDGIAAIQYYVTGVISIGALVYSLRVKIDPVSDG